MTQGSGEREATKGRSEGRERWSVEQKAEVVLRLLRGEDLMEASWEVRVPPPQLEKWRRVFLETRTKDARELLRKRMEEIGKGRLIGPDAEKVTLGDLGKMLVTDYELNGRRTLDRAKGAIKNLVAFFGPERRALDLTTDRANDFIAHRMGDGAKPGTIRREVAALKRMFGLAVQAGRLPSAPHIPTIQVDNVREGFFETADLEAILAELSEPLRPVVTFANLTGWRKAEILSLTWAQVDFESRVIRLAPGTTKNRDGREFPFGTFPALAELLEEQRERTRKIEKERGEIIPYVFHRDGARIKSIRTAWNAAARRAGLAGVLFHDLRRTAVRNLEKAGVPRSVATKLTGHKTEEVYRRYAIADRVALEEGVEKLARLHATPTGARKVEPIRREASGA